MCVRYVLIELNIIYDPCVLAWAWGSRAPTCMPYLHAQDPTWSQMAKDDRPGAPEDAH